MTSSEHDISEESVHHALLDLKIDDILLLTVINAGKLGLLGFFLYYLDLIDDLCWKVLGSKLRIVKEECLSVNSYLRDSLSVGRNRTVLIDFHSGKLFQKFLEGIIFRRLER